MYGIGCCCRGQCCCCSCCCCIYYGASAETALGTSAYYAVRLCSRIICCIEIVIYSKRLKETSISSQLSQTFFATLVRLRVRPEPSEGRAAPAWAWAARATAAPLNLCIVVHWRHGQCSWYHRYDLGALSYQGGGDAHSTRTARLYVTVSRGQTKASMLQ